MSLKDIIERFALVSGLEMKDVSRFLPVIADCKDLFEARLGTDLSEGDLRRAANACAVYAFYRISLLGRMDELVSFRVGDVQMNSEAAGAAAERLWAEERENIGDIADVGGDFVFRRVIV